MNKIYFQLDIRNLNQRTTAMKFMKCKLKKIHKRNQIRKSRNINQRIMSMQRKSKKDKDDNT